MIERIRENKINQFGTVQLPERFFLNADGSCDREKDPYIMAKEVVEKGVLPPIYMACGTEDELYEDNVRMRNALADAGAEIDWQDGAGAHEWTYWDEHIEKAIDWWLKRSTEK